MEVKKKVPIIKYTTSDEKETIDEISIEYPLLLSINKINLATLMCTPDSMKALCVGFIYSEGIIGSYQDIHHIDFDEKKRQVNIELKTKDTYIFSGQRILGQRTVTSGCGKNRTISYPLPDPSHKKTGPMPYNKATLLALMHDFNSTSTLFKDTGGVHTCGLADSSTILIVEDDIGRHNALDKIIGWSLMNQITMSDKLLLTTGRISSDIISKMIRASIPLIVSRSAPTSHALELAKKYKIQIIGFARGQRMNIY